MDRYYMFSFDTYKRQWTGNVRADLLSGLVVALALIPEAIAFSIIAGVDPKVGLYASFSIAVRRYLANSSARMTCSRAESPAPPNSTGQPGAR